MTKHDEQSQYASFDKQDFRPGYNNKRLKVERLCLKRKIGRFYTIWTELGKHLEFVWLFVSSIKTDTRRIMRVDGHFHKNSPYQYKQSGLSLQCIAATGCCNQSPDLFTRSDLSPRRVAATCRLVCSDI